MLFIERGYEAVSTADVARAAGVTTALVHHYFGSKRELYVAVVQWIVETARDVSTGVVKSDEPLQARVESMIDAWLDYLEEDGSAWVAVTAYGEIVDPEITALAERARQTCAERIVRSYAEFIPDTPTARFAIRSFIALNEAVSREWLDGKVSREQAHLLLVETLLHILSDVTPALDATARRPAARRRAPASALSEPEE